MSGTKKSGTGGQHTFSKIPSAEIQRSQINRSCGIKTTFDTGILTPIFTDEVLPGDTFNLNLTMFARLSTLLFPIMDNIYLDCFFFFVPNRLVWDNWEKFNGAQDNPDDLTEFEVPNMDAPATVGHAVGSLSDYMGIPVGIPDLEHNSLAHRGYSLIWNEWFRDENLQDSVVVDKDDGPDDPTDYVLLPRGKRHDYFTSSLPWPQKGDAVEIPLGTTAPVVPTAIGDPWFHDGTVSSRLEGVSGFTKFFDTSLSGQLEWGGITGLQTDLSTATAATVNALRQAFQIQKMYERDARGGTRYTEIIKAHFGVTSPDARLQRTEYLGGGSTPVLLTPTASTSATATVELGELAAYGIAQTGGIGFRKSFVEHGWVIGMVASRADINYYQGLPKQFSRVTRFDYYWPALSHLGEQNVLNKEIWAQGSDDLTADAATFGFQERYAEYRYKPSLLTGLMRPGVSGSLATWHVAQAFATLPVLNDEFIVESPAMDRVLTFPTEPHFIFDGFFQYVCARPMPIYGVPGMMDHF